MDEARATDASLLARIAQRDPQALDAFYVRHARAVFSLACAVLHDHTRATAITQDVFLLIWRSAGAYQPTGSARAWVLRLTRTRALDELRRDPHHLPRAPAFPEQTGRDRPDPPDVAEAAERQAVRDALAALPEDQYEALHLAFFQGCSHRELATRLRTPLGVIKARLRSAFHTLRQQWRAEAGG